MSSSNNSFRNLEEQQDQQYPDAPVQVEHALRNTMDLVKTIGHLFDLYFNKSIELFLLLSASSPKEPDNTKPPSASKDVN